MKYREILLEHLKNMPFFQKKEIYTMAKQYFIKDATIDAYINRSLKLKDIIQLKKGLYITNDFYEKNISNISYKFYLANILRSPSYVSSWTALQYYDLTTEAIGGVISVSRKITRNFQNKVGSFVYHYIKEELFSGFDLKKEKFLPPAREFDFFIAAPSKALFDLIYFKTNQFRGIHFKEINKIIEELRIDIDEMSEEERKKFYKITKDFLKKYE